MKVERLIADSIRCNPDYDGLKAALFYTSQKGLGLIDIIGIALKKSTSRMTHVIAIDAGIYVLLVESLL